MGIDTHVQNRWSECGLQAKKKSITRKQPRFLIFFLIEILVIPYSDIQSIESD